MIGLGRILCVALASLFVSVAIAAADEQPAPPAPPAPVEAQPEPPAPPEAPPPPPAATEDDDPMICKTEEPGVGSRMRGRRVCKKRSEWGERPSGIIHLPDGSFNHPTGGGVGGGSRGPSPGGVD